MAAEIVIYAKERLGEELAKVEKAKGGGDQRSNHRYRNDTGDKPATLADLGVTKKEAAEAQRIASIPKATLRDASADDYGGERIHATLCVLLEGQVQTFLGIADLCAVVDAVHQGKPIPPWHPPRKHPANLPLDRIADHRRVGRCFN